MSINRTHPYRATVETNRGTFVITLLPAVAPVAVNNFVFLARHHYFDNNPVIRIVQEFLIQTGDPTGTGSGGPGYEFDNEKVTTHYSPGVVAMANHGHNTNGSQFFVVTGLEARGLPPLYTIFGRVSRGFGVVRRIAHTPVTQNIIFNNELSQPLQHVYLKRVTIQGSP